MVIFFLHKMVRSLSKCIYVEFRYSRSIVWWEICPKFIFTTICVHLYLGCLKFYSGHPIFRYTKKVIKINSRTVFLQKSDRLYLNLTDIHFESDLNSVEHPLSTTNLLSFSLNLPSLQMVIYAWLTDLTTFFVYMNLGCPENVSK